MMKLLLIPAVLALLVPALAAYSGISGPPESSRSPDLPESRAAIGGPKVFFIASQGHGEAMSPAFTYSGFGETPAFSAHTNAQGVDIRDVSADDGRLRFAVSYANTAPNNFEVIVFATNGQGTALERHRVEVRRSN